MALCGVECCFSVHRFHHQIWSNGAEGVDSFYISQNFAHQAEGTCVYCTGATHIRDVLRCLRVVLLQGKYYMLLEYASQMYRSLIPAPLWFRYLSNYYQTGRLFAVFITAIYLMIKVGGALISIIVGGAEAQLPF